MKEKIYLDNGATTQVHSLVIEKMLPFLNDKFGNPSSIHSFGKKVKVAIEEARLQIAEDLNTKPPRITFTSGGTEADHLAIVGAALANMEKGRHIIVSTIEHSAIMESVEWLKNYFGFEITYISTNQTGRIQLDELKDSIREDTILISVMYVNNEVGTIQPIVEIGQIAKENEIIFHTDAVQAFPIMELDMSSLPVDLLTISSHKINGPKGVGALYIREGIAINPIVGGSQERSRRGGTENVPGIIGFGEAVRILRESREEKYHQLSKFKRLMMEEWQEQLGEGDFFVNGALENTVPSILSVSFPGISSHMMIMQLDIKGIAVSGGSACASGAVTTSRVIQALELPKEIAESTVRISFGSYNTEEEIMKAAKAITHIVKNSKNSKNKRK